MNKPANQKLRLKNKISIQELFSSGKRNTHFPFKINYAVLPDENEQISIGVGVSKKNLRKAVDRNKVKRQLRSLTKKFGEPVFNNLINDSGKSLHIMILYIGRKPMEYTKNIENYKKALSKICIE